MLRRAKCGKCIHCVFEDLDSYNIGCTMFGDCREKYSCIHFMTEKEKELIEKIKEIENYGRN
jgi:hypothetical protein